MAKKTNILLFIILLIVLSLIYIGSVLRNYYSFANDIVLNPSITTQNNDTITVIFIGESWAAYHSKYDHHLMTCIEKKVKKPTKVISKGTVGAKTKSIYKEMHIDGPSGTKELIELSPDYAIVSAGINDAVAKMGAENYCHHYDNIARRVPL